MQMAFTATAFCISLTLLSSPALARKHHGISPTFTVSNALPSPVNQTPGATETTVTSAAPNPFNPVVTVGFALIEAGFCELAVYDLSGRRIRILVSGAIPDGYHEAVWDGRDEADRDAATGVYICRLRTSAATTCRKLTLVR